MCLITISAELELKKLKNLWLGGGGSNCLNSNKVVCKLLSCIGQFMYKQVYMYRMSLLQSPDVNGNLMHACIILHELGMHQSTVHIR